MKSGLLRLEMRLIGGGIIAVIKPRVARLQVVAHSSRMRYHLDLSRGVFKANIRRGFHLVGSYTTPLITTGRLLNVFISPKED